MALHLVICLYLTSLDKRLRCPTPLVQDLVVPSWIKTCAIAWQHAESTRLVLPLACSRGGAKQVNLYCLDFAKTENHNLIW